MRRLFQKKNAVALLVPVTTLTFLPNNYDAFNIPKLLALVITMNFLFLINYDFLHLKLSVRAKQLIAVYCMIICIGIIKSSDISSAILGNYAQNTGLLALMMCLGLAIFILKYSDADLSSKIYESIIFTGVVVSTYAVLQKFNLDPINWTEKGWIVSTLGNPNFSSSFLAIVSLISIISILSEKNNFKKIYYAVSGALNIIGCYSSNSDQGYAILALGGVFLLINLVLRIQNIMVKNAALSSIVLILATFAALFLFKIEEFNFLKTSLQYRFYYWQASLAIIRNNLLLGTGFGDFEDEFFKNRSLDHFLNGRGEYAASAHNYILEFYSLGGLMLGTGYLVFCIVITHYVIRLRNYKGEKNTKDWQILFISWLSFQLQSLVSIPIVSFLIFGTLISFLIIKRYVNLQTVNEVNHLRKLKNPTIQATNWKRLGATVLLTSNLAFASLLLNNDNKLKQVIEYSPATIEELEVKKNSISNLLKFPIYREEYKFLLARNLFNQGIGYEAEPLMKDATKSELHSYRKYWYLAYFYMNIGKDSESLRSFYEAIKFDPMNLNLRKDFILLLRKKNEIDAAKDELDKLEKLAPSSEQFRSLS